MFFELNRGSCRLIALSFVKNTWIETGWQQQSYPNAAKHNVQYLNELTSLNSLKLLHSVSCVNNKKISHARKASFLVIALMMEVV